MIQMSGMVSGNVTVYWQSSPGTATPGSDYTHASGSVQLSQSMSFANVSVCTLTDANYDPNETFNIQITSVTGDATLGSPSSAQITIQDSQPPGDGGGGQPTYLSVTSPGTLVEGQSFNLLAAVSPRGLYWLTGTVNWGTSPVMGSESFSTFTMMDGQFWLPHQYYDDGPRPGNGTTSDISAITVTVGSLVGTSNATINNIAPTGSGFTVTNVDPVGGPVWRVEGFVQDYGANGDLLDVTIDWGNGSATAASGNEPSRKCF